MGAVDPNARFDLSKAATLVIDGSQHSLEMTAQMLRGFGATNITRSSTIESAEMHTQSRCVDLIIIDPTLEQGLGYDFIVGLRKSGGPSAFSPVILVSGHVRASDVLRARNTGANCIVTKPLSPTILLQRILWVARDNRPFVQGGDYIGPDRRFKFEGPPPGSDGRRASDLKSPLGDAAEPNMSQDEVSALIKPQRIVI